MLSAMRGSLQKHVPARLDMCAHQLRCAAPTRLKGSAIAKPKAAAAPASSAGKQPAAQTKTGPELDKSPTFKSPKPLTDTPLSPNPHKPGSKTEFDYLRINKALDPLIGKPVTQDDAMSRAALFMRLRGQDGDGLDDAVVKDEGYEGPQSFDHIRMWMEDPDNQEGEWPEHPDLTRAQVRQTLNDADREFWNIPVPDEVNQYRDIPYDLKGYVKRNQEHVELGLKKLKMEDVFHFRYIVKTWNHAHVIRSGKTFKTSVMVLGGNRDGVASWSYASDKTGREGALTKAFDKLYKRALFVPRTARKSIAYPVQGRFKQTRIKILPARPDFGTKGCWLMQYILQAFGITDVTARFYGRNNTYHMVLAAFHALSQVQSAETLARGSGRVIYRYFEPGDETVYQPRRDDLERKAQFVRNALKWVEEKKKEDFLGSNKHVIREPTQLPRPEDFMNTFGSPYHHQMVKHPAARGILDAQAAGRAEQDAALPPPDDLLNSLLPEDRAKAREALEVEAARQRVLRKRRQQGQVITADDQISELELEQALQEVRDQMPKDANGQPVGLPKLVFDNQEVKEEGELMAFYTASQESDTVPEDVSTPVSDDVEEDDARQNLEDGALRDFPPLPAHEAKAAKIMLHPKNYMHFDDSTVLRDGDTSVAAEQLLRFKEEAGLSGPPSEASEDTLATAPATMVKSQARPGEEDLEASVVRSLATIMDRRLDGLSPQQLRATLKSMLQNPSTSPQDRLMLRVLREKVAANKEKAKAQAYSQLQLDALQEVANEEHRKDYFEARSIKAQAINRMKVERNAQRELDYEANEFNMSDYTTDQETESPIEVLRKNKDDYVPNFLEADSVEPETDEGTVAYNMRVQAHLKAKYGIEDLPEEPAASEPSDADAEAAGKAASEPADSEPPAQQRRRR